MQNFYIVFLVLYASHSQSYNWLHTLVSLCPKIKTLLRYSVTRSKRSLMVLGLRPHGVSWGFLVYDFSIGSPYLGLKDPVFLCFPSSSLLFLLWIMSLSHVFFHFDIFRDYFAHSFLKIDLTCILLRTDQDNFYEGYLLRKQFGEVIIQETNVRCSLRWLVLLLMTFVLIGASWSMLWKSPRT